MRFHIYSPYLAVGLSIFPAQALADTVLTVGPGGQYQTISRAVAVADADNNLANGYVIEVMPGTYINDFPYVTRPMTIKRLPKSTGKVVLQATEDLPNQKGIILTISSLTVDGLTFKGAHITNPLGGNGAGIRDQNTASGASLTVLNSTFVGNQEGILQGDDLGETVTIVNSKFVNNGNPNQTYLQHGVYIDSAASLTVSNSLFCGQLIGTDVKSRAAVTTVENNVLLVGEADSALGCRTGTASFAIDLPNGGVATISGNQMTQGAATQNDRMIDYGEGPLLYSNNSFLVSGNSFVSIGVTNSIAIYDPQCVTVDLVNNTFQGIGTIVEPAACAAYQ